MNDPLSCDAHKKEVCLFINGTYKCQCAAGRDRLPDGRCLVINECKDSRLNDCSLDADCVDQVQFPFENLQFNLQGVLKYG